MNIMIATLGTSSPLEVQGSYDHEPKEPPPCTVMQQKKLMNEYKQPLFRSPVSTQITKNRLFVLIPLCSEYHMA